LDFGVVLLTLWRKSWNPCQCVGYWDN